MKAYQSGIGLFELLMALFLSSLLMSALIQHYLIIKRHYLNNQAKLNQLSELLFIEDMIRHSIHMAGFTPCLGLTQLITMDRRTADELPLTPISVRNRDEPSLFINHMDEKFSSLINTPQSSQLLATNDRLIRSKRPVLITDCYHAEVQNIVAIFQTGNQQDIRLQKPLMYDYHLPIYIGEWIEERYFLRLKKGLFYQQRHTDKVSSIIDDLSFEIKKNEVKVIFGIKKNKWIINTLLRQ